MASSRHTKPRKSVSRRAALHITPTTGIQAAAADPPRHQQCALCLELFKSPRILPCFHTFCLACLEQLVRSNSAAVSFSCPTCRAAVQIPSGGVSKFQVNFYVEAAMENLQISQVGSTRVCDMCGKENASSKCVDCDQFACDNCTKVHGRIGTTKSHTVLNLNAQRQDAVVIKERFCTTHSDEKIRFFCTQCRTVLCRDCKLTSHEGHSTTDLSRRSQNAKKMLLDVAKKSRNMTPKLKTSLQKAEKCKKDLTVKKSKILATFRTRADEIRKTIDSCLQQAEENLNNKSGKLEKELTQTVEDMQQQIASLDSLCDHLEQVARVGCDADVLSLPEQIAKFFGCNTSMEAQFLRMSSSQFREETVYEEEFFAREETLYDEDFLPGADQDPDDYNYQSEQAVNMQGEITPPFQVFTNEAWCKDMQLENVSTHQQAHYYQRGYNAPLDGDLKGMISEKIGKMSVISVGHSQPLDPQQLPRSHFGYARRFQQHQQQPLAGTVSQDIADIQSVIDSWLNSG